MNKSLLLFFIIITNVTFAQEQPKMYKAFWNNEDMYIVNHLILSTDSVFFNFSSCECGNEYYGKGKWKIKGTTLYLYGFDSTRAFPKTTVNYIEGDTSQYITISAFDYFKKPMKHLLLGLIYNDTISFRTTHEFVDSTGKLVISKKDFMGFYLIYESLETSGLLGGKNPFYYFNKDTKKIIIYVDFAEAGLDRLPIPFNYGNRAFKLKKGNLYGKGKKPIFLANPHDN